MSCVNFGKRANVRVTIQSRSETKSDYGGITLSYSDVATVWAEMKPVSGKEIFEQGQTQSRVTHKLLIRYRSGMKNTASTASYRITYDSRVFAIQYIQNLDDKLEGEGTAFQRLFIEENAPEEV